MILYCSIVRNKDFLPADFESVNFFSFSGYHGYRSFLPDIYVRSCQVLTTKDDLSNKSRSFFEAIFESIIE